MRKTLADGIYLNLIPTKQFKTIRVVIRFIAPLERATATQRSLLASILEANSADYPTQADLAAKLQEMYGASFNIGAFKEGNAHILSVELNLVNDRYLHGEPHLLKTGIDFLRRILFHPHALEGAFDATTFNRERDNMANYLRSIVDDKQSYAAIQLDKLYFDADSDQQVTGYGSLDDLAQIDPASLWDYYQHLLAHDRIEISVLGDIDEAEVVPDFAAFPLEARPLPDVKLFYQQPLVPDVQEQTKKQEIVQSKLDLAYQIEDYFYGPHYYELLVTNGMFGGNPLSLLFANVREKASLAYYASSNIDAFRGLMTVQCGIDAQNKEQVLAIIKDQLHDLQTGHFAAALLQQTQADLINHYNSALDSPRYLTSQAFYKTLVPEAVIDAHTFEKGILQVTAQQVQERAQTIRLQAIYFLEGEAN
ncbi:metalloprotease [Lactobacillus selangorensis]|uniref:Metalloprotease n=1 Tax=Lactobacillus selangorensis TaxID=81857 RepID=A0A0R2FUM1_9LACO|nr:pitrilysin family protein [Lactobacillus selangorensis]KRN28459.1 metalloprotease [Lactobacillus selangorensis]KRN31960.1 metalloprotease [Lactobacillus selangorensis]